MKQNYNVCFLFAFLSFTPCHSQSSIPYLYDQGGNRIMRKVFVLQGPQSIKIHAIADCTTVEEMIKSGEIRIYPNPTRGVIKIDYSSSQDE